MRSRTIGPAAPLQWCDNRGALRLGEGGGCVTTTRAAGS
jgi:hypothetical protein